MKGVAVLLALVVVVAGAALAWALSEPRPRYSAEEWRSLGLAGDPAAGRLVFYAGGCDSCHKSQRQVDPLKLGGGLELKAARKRQIEDRLVAGSQYRGGEYVASNQLGEPLHPDAITSRWEKLLKGLGVPAVRLHDARHSCATLMHLRGVPIAVIAAWLGHASAAFTMATYAHSQDDALKAAASSFGRVVTFCDTETSPRG